MKCLSCNKDHNGLFGSGKYCSRACANRRSLSEETKNKISESKKGKYNGNQEKIVIADGVEYKSLSEAARKLGKVPATILNRIKSKNPKFTGYYYK